MNSNELYNRVQSLQNEPYANYLLYEVQKMSPEKLEYLAQNIAPYYFDGTQNDADNIKLMMLMSKELNNNRDPISIAQQRVNDYALASRMAQGNLPIFQQPIVQQPIQPQPIQPQSIQPPTQQELANTYQIMENLGLRKYYQFYTTDEMLSKHTNDQKPQGFKFHISTGDINDFNKSLTTLTPLFTAMGVDYKISDPSSYYNNKREEQNGKAITVYSGKMFEIIFSQNAFDDKYLKENFTVDEQKTIIANRHKFAEATEYIFGQNIPNNIKVPQGDIPIGGRIFARYGRERPQNLNISRLTNDQKYIIAQNLCKIGKAHSMGDVLHEFDNYQSINKYDRKYLTEFEGVKMDLMIGSDGSYIPDTRNQIPDHIKPLSSEPAKILFNSLILESQFKNGEIPLKGYLQQKHTGILASNTNGTVCYEYGESKHDKKGVLGMFVSNKKQQEINNQCKSVIEQALHKPTGYKSDFTNTTTFFEHNGKNYVIFTKDTAKMIVPELQNSLGSNFKLADFENRERQEQMYDDAR
jgi:hypothetical protein